MASFNEFILDYQVQCSNVLFLVDNFCYDEKKDLREQCDKNKNKNKNKEALKIVITQQPVGTRGQPRLTACGDICANSALQFRVHCHSTNAKIDDPQYLPKMSDGLTSSSKMVDYALFIGDQQGDQPEEDILYQQDKSERENLRKTPGLSLLQLRV
ncbi:hypothetical protein CEP51_010447 [Fusarium floridanum]|uniref:PD-(D/E)XK nuclease-like domain-containing protein n=1 Tax=Fusarium floridanum TaxID=1325733 RepID=A0A428RED6_9HYPO|nr:hypothetical protein CEP51_010447 [Fusarium floridanum]